METDTWAGSIFLILVFGLWGPLNCSLPEKPRKGRFAGTDWLGSPRGHDTSLFQRQTNKIPPSSFGIGKWALATLHSSFFTRIKPMAVSLMDLTWRCHVASWNVVNFQITDPAVTFTLADDCKMCCEKQKLQTSNLKKGTGNLASTWEGRWFFLVLFRIHINLCKSTYDTRHPPNRSLPSGKCRYFCFGLVAKAILHT